VILAAAGDKYDLVVASEVIEHVQDPTSFVKTLSGLVRTQEKGGHLFLSTINRTLKSYVVAILGAEKVTKLVPAGMIRPHICTMK
jgi:2-polyprenyl-6-hydroxyphenyl methylase/3-demethylubiquinone-9 3-methyltransferase